MGLFLVLNVIRRLGGEVRASNKPDGGATVSLSVPLKSVVLEHANG